MIAKAFLVSYKKQSPVVNKLLIAADLGIIGAVDHHTKEIRRVTVDWSEGEIVDAPRIEQTMINLRKAFEEYGYCGVNVKELKQ